MKVHIFKILLVIAICLSLCAYSQSRRSVSDEES